MRKLNRKGFTLVELMVVLAILGLLALVGIPQYTQVMERARIGRDLAQIATVQTVVTAFVTETDLLEQKDRPIPTPLSDQNNEVASITAKSYLTGGDVDIRDFFEAGETGDTLLPKLESRLLNEGEGPEWLIDKNGNVYVENGKYTLPEQPGGGN